MPLRAAFRPRYVGPVTAATITTALLLHTRSAHAEEQPGSSQNFRKPIYDDPTLPPSPSSESAPPEFPQHDSSRGSLPTPTDRLALRIKQTRLALYHYAHQAESSLNVWMKRAFAMERDFTQTIASLAPPAESNEAVMPGVIYVLVATLAGSIVSRNRGIVLRTMVPLAFGTTAAYAALPITMENVGELYRDYESKYPALHSKHAELNQRTRYIWETGKAHTLMTVERGTNMLDEAREKMEDWVKQGK